jgi:hypothetical protein
MAESLKTGVAPQRFFRAFCAGVAQQCSSDENGTDIFRSYSKPNSFREVLIRPYSSTDI